MLSGQIISYLKSCKMISKGILYHVVRVNQECETPSIESAPVVRQFPEVFPNNLPRVPPKREIDFGIDLLPEKNRI